MHEEEVNEEMVMSDDAIKEEIVEEDEEEYMPLHDGVPQHVEHEVVLHEEVVDHGDEQRDSGIVDQDNGDSEDAPMTVTNKAGEYFADEHNTARALLSLTCAKLQRDVSGE